MKTAVVILNWNTKDYLERFLPPLLQSCEGLDAEVIVADNASSDASLELLSASFPAVKTIALDRNYGFTGGYNRALESLDAEYFVLINSDVEVSQGWLAPLVCWMDTHPDCGACAPKLHALQDRDSFEYAGAAGGLIDAFGYPFCRGRVLSRVEKDEGQYDSPATVLWATGACLMVRSSVWRSMGGLDDRFFAHMEEIDMCWRMQLAGWKVQVVPESLVYHLGGGTLPQNSPFKLRLNYRNNLLMLENNLAKSFALESGNPHKALRRANRLIGVRMLLDWGSALVYALTLKWDYVKAVYHAHEEFRALRRPVTPDELSRLIEENPARRNIIGRWKGCILLEAMLLRERIFAYLRKCNSLDA